MISQYIRWFEELGTQDVGLVGGKNASLGEMVCRLKQAGIRVPDGFATTVAAYDRFLDYNGLTPQIQERMRRLRDGEASLETTGKSIRGLFLGAEFPEDVAAAIREAYRELSNRYATIDLTWQSGAARPLRTYRARASRDSRSRSSILWGMGR
jgi:pyruvate,water dikinase